MTCNMVFYLPRRDISVKWEIWYNRWPKMSMWCTFRRFNSLSNGMSIIPKRKRLSFSKLKRNSQKYRNITLWQRRNWYKRKCSM